ncbi:cystathionine beta-lyase [Caenibius tardaugens NBRC 16725]|uniref:Cystathionine beta-lyase n=1 Tax=Caenibius tardaugens NBRC 16725 TaxID=1219035 RepID=U3A421_9SPHN|nr:cystathionine beta-lyase [Caenibius tardaugens]AZI36823.1 cystathionine beta-lyase [Caenibius tardaugens NBRC 16725]GAD49503.1 cystathionine beta-lyase [Caenibius tardaugens NBRC 16725]
MKKDDALRESGVGTRLVAAGRRPEWTGTADQPGSVVNPAVWRASTHLYDSVAALKEGGKTNADGRFYYGRRGAPTQWALSEALTELEPGAAGTLLYPSGVAAIAGALLALVKPGDHVLMADNVYEPSRNIGQGLLANFGVTTEFFDPLDRDGFAARFTPNTRAVLLEAPGSLTMEVPDIPAFAAITREKGAVSLIDNTWASPLGFPALERGCDIAIMSLTKHVGGHSDLMMGSVAAGDALYRRLRRTHQQLGQVVSPDDAALALRGLRTLQVRLARGAASALEIAGWLATRPEVSQVLCPMLPGAPGYETWARTFTGGCGLFSFLFRNADEAAQNRFVDALELFGIGYSWGGFESLVVPLNPAGCRSATSWPPEGANPADCFGVRLAIGLEDPADLIADLERAFARMRG